jgi:hypothetical protein
MQTKVTCGTEETHTAAASQKHSSENDFPEKEKKKKVMKH